MSVITKSVVRTIIPAEPGWNVAILTGIFGPIEEAAFQHYPIIAWDIDCIEARREGQQPSERHWSDETHYALPIMARVMCVPILDPNDLGMSWVFRCPDGKYRWEDMVYENETEALRDLYVRTQKRRTKGDGDEEARHAAKLLSAATAADKHERMQALLEPSPAS